VEFEKSNLQKILEGNKFVDNQIKNLYIKKGISAEKINELMQENGGHGILLNAAQAKEYGFIHEISQGGKQVACMTKDYFVKAGYPKLPNGYEFLIENEQQSNPTLWENIKNEIKKQLQINKSTNQQNQQINNTILMKNTFPTIVNLLAFGDNVQYDAQKGVTLNDEQLKKIEAQLASLTALQTEKTNLETEKTNLTATVAEKEEKITELQEIVDKVPVPAPLPNGKDAGDNEVSSFYEKYTKNNALCKEVAKKTGQEL